MVEHDSDFGFLQRLPRLTFCFDGELDVSRIGELDRALIPASKLYGVELIVDLTRVTFLDSEVIGWLTCVQADIRSRMGRLRVLAARDGELVGLLSQTALQDQIEVAHR